MANLLKFYRVATLPATGEKGGLYFVTGEGILYVYNGTSFEAYSGLKTAVVEEGVLKITKHDGSVVEYKAGEIATSLINALDYEDTAVEGEYVSEVDQVDGKISVKRAALPTVEDAVVAGSYVSGVSQDKGKITVTREALPSVADAAVAGKYVSAVSETNGQIAVTRETLPVIGVKADDKILALDVNDSLLSATVALSYDATAGEDGKKYIRLTGKEGADLGKIDATEFIKDGMLENAGLVWCTIADGVHTEVPEGTKGAVRCLKLVFNTDAAKETVHIPVADLYNDYTGRATEIEIDGQNVIGLVDKTVVETSAELAPVYGGTVDVVTDVTYDAKGRIAGVETTTVTLPKAAAGDKTGSDDYVSVQVKTVDGAVSEVVVTTDALTEKITAIEKEINDNEIVTAAALNDLNERMTTAEGSIVEIQEVIDGLNVGVTSVAASTSSAHVTVAPTTASEGAVTLTVDVASVDAAAGGSTGLATDAYVREQISPVATVANSAVQTVASAGNTLQVTRTANAVNVELCWMEGSF